MERNKWTDLETTLLGMGIIVTFIIVYIYYKRNCTNRNILQHSVSFHNEGCNDINNRVWPTLSTKYKP